MKVKGGVKKTIMRSLTINELSGVDVPAQEGASVMILKRLSPVVGTVESLKSLVDSGDWPGIKSALISPEGRLIALKCLLPRQSELNSDKPDILQKYNHHLVEKMMMLTTVEDGHQHSISLDSWDLERGGGSTSYRGEGGEDTTHSHDYIISPDGAITIGESNGHTHSTEMTIMQTLQVAFAGKSAKTDDEKSSDKLPPKGGDLNLTEKVPMDEEEVKALVAKSVTEAVATANAALVKAQAFGKLTDVQKAHYDGLDETAKSVFLSLTPQAQQAEVELAVAKRNDSNPIVYKSLDGTEYRRSDDVRLVSMAKSDDVTKTELAGLRKVNQQAALTKRAEELTYLPGTTEVKVEMLKAIDSIADVNARTQALETLKAQNDAMSTAFKNYGARPNSTGASTPEGQLDVLAKNYAKANSVDEATAYSKVLDTPEGRELYQQSVQQ